MNEQQMYAPPQYTPKSQQEIDADNLSTLAVCHYVAGAVIAVFSCFLLIYIGFGLFITKLPMTTGNQSPYASSQPYGATGASGTNGASGAGGQSGTDTAPGADHPIGGDGTPGAGGSPSTYGRSNQQLPFNPGYIFVVFGCVGLVIGWTGAALTIYAGRCISARKHYVFILIVAGLGCVFMNLINTTLGVFTFIILLRPTVKVLFEGQRV